MKFTKMEVCGFKSFADKLEIKFNDGITGIVGPNGCGKSNIADAIRWVLGEQSAKALRGDNMLDVIFNGTEKRNSLSYCEVSLFFANDDNTLPVEFSEVVVTRKLYRSRESEYMINRAPCRRCDVVDLLRDIGVGKEGYSIIGQGRIDALLSAKPEDRRSIFEEACGIAKFKQKRRETENKLSRTRDSLSRINDILGEIGRQLSPLEKASENAKIFLEKKEILKSQELNYYIDRYDHVNETKAVINGKLAAVGASLQEKQSTYAEASRDYDETMDKIAHIDDEVKQLQEERVTLRVGIERQNSEYNLVQEKIKHLNQLCVKLEFDIASYEQSVERARHGLGESQSQKARDTRELAELNARAERISQQFIDVVAQISKGENEADASEKQLYDSLQQLSDIKANLSGLAAEKKAISDRHTELVAKITSLEEENRGRRAAVDEIKAALDEKAAELEESRENRNQLALSAENSGRLLERNKRELQQLASAAAGLEAKERMLSRIAENNEGYVNSVRLLLNDCRRDPTLDMRVCGTVAKLMTVPQQYEVAIDVALGAAMQNIVVHTQNDAKSLIAYLKQMKYGRITFLPMDAVKERPAEGYLVAKVKRSTGYIGLADELIETDRKYRAIYSSLLGRTIICDDIDNAVNIAREINYGMRIVTLEGDVIHPAGAMTGGSRRTEASSLLSAERELAEVKEELRVSVQRRKQLSTDVEKLEAVAGSRRRQLESMDEQLHAAELEFAVVNEKFEKATADLEEHLKERDALVKDIESIEARIKAIEENLAHADKLESQVAERKESADDFRSKTKGAYDVLRKKRDQLSADATQIKVDIARVESQLSAAESEINRYADEIKGAEEQINFVRTQLANSRADLAELENPDEKLELDEASQKKLEDIEKRLADFDRYKKDLQKRLTDSDRLRNQLNLDITDLNDKKYREEFNLSKVDTDMAAMQDRIWEDYQCTYEDALPFRAENFDAEAAPANIALLKKEIAKLGYVNVDAIEEYKETKERYDELDLQRDDTLKAANDLDKIVRDLTAEMLDRFGTGFDLINRNFQRVFKELFGGGSAKLSLEDLEEGEDPLEAGIQIYAEPPGKKLGGSLSLLSGGEKALTAIAILFAILKMKPMPFCVLDEIEAALDDANVTRFANYLQNFSQETQFIVITHRKPTMELADSLYGVTMEEKGVSKMVSVKLSDAVKLEQEAQAESRETA